MDARKLIVAASTVLLLGLMAPSVAQAQSLAASFAPAAVSLPADGGSRSAALILDNGTQDSVTVLELSPRAPSTVQWESDLQPVHLAPGQRVAYEFLVSQAAGVPVDDTMSVLVTYRTTAQEAPSAAVATLALKTGAVMTSDQVTEVKVLAAADTLQIDQELRVHLVMRNKLATPLFVTVEVLPPLGIEARPSQRTQSVRIEPRHETIFTYLVSVQGRIDPGKQSILFHVTGRWGDNSTGTTPDISPARSVSLVVSKDITPSAFGESGLVALVGVPLFLLPGFLMLGVVALLAGFGILRLPSDTWKAPDAKSPEWIVVAVIVSAIVWAVVRAVFEFNYLVSYELRDLAWVWGGSILTALILYAVLAGIRYSRVKERTPTEDDSELTTLRRLSRQGCRVTMPRVLTAPVTVGGQGAKPVAFYLQRPNVQRKTTWIAPPIQVEWRVDDEASLEIQRQLESELREKKRAGRVADLLEAAGDKVSVRWRDTPGLAKPRQVVTSEVTPAEEDFLVEVR